MIRRYLILLLALVVTTGCSPRRDRGRDKESTFAHKPADAVAVVVLDKSGSFDDLLLGRENRAFVFLTELIKQFFYNGIGTEQRLVIGQISGSPKPLLFDGTIRDFHARFPDADSFRDYLKKLKAPDGSRVFDSVREVLSFTLRLPTVVKGHTKVGLFVLSDCDDNMETPRSLPQLEAELKILATEYEGSAAFYFVDQLLYERMVQLLQRCRFPPGRGLVTSGITEKPPIPKLSR